MTKPHEMHQFDLVNVLHDFFEGNRNNSILTLVTGVEVAFRYKVPKPLFVIGDLKNSGY